MRLADMTWQEVRDYLAARDALIVPIGTCEQHGAHLPLATDTLIAEAFAERIAGETGVALAPTLAYGVNLPCDRFVPGTAGFSLDGLRRALGDLLRDWARQGFRRFFVVTAHGCAVDGYGFAHHEAIKGAALPLLSDGACEVLVLFPYWTEVGDILSNQDKVEHACEVETSLALHLFPELVRVDRIEDGPPEWEGVRYQAFPEGVSTGPPPSGWSGAEGSPSAGTAEKGRAIFDRCLEPMIQAVRTLIGPSG